MFSLDEVETTLSRRSSQCDLFLWPGGSYPVVPQNPPGRRQHCGEPNRPFLCNMGWSWPLLFMAQLHLLYTRGQVSPVTLANRYIIICIMYVYIYIHTHTYEQLYISFKSFGWKLLDKTCCCTCSPELRMPCLESWKRLEYFICIDQRVQPATRLSFSCPLSAACYMSPSMADTLQKGKLRKSCQVGSVNTVSGAICFNPSPLFICFHHHGWWNPAITM